MNIESEHTHTNVLIHYYILISIKIYRRNGREEKHDCYEGEQEKEKRERTRKYCDIPVCLTHLVPARVLPARRVSRSLPYPVTPAFACTSIYTHIRTHTHVRWAHIPEVSRSWLPEKRREETTSFSHPRLSTCQSIMHFLVAPAGNSSSSISSVFERFARGSWENEAGGS